MCEKDTEHDLDNILSKIFGDEKEDLLRELNKMNLGIKIVTLNEKSWQPWTEGLRRVIVYAEEMAEEMKLKYIGTELFLSVLIRMLPDESKVQLQKYEVTEERIKQAIVQDKESRLKLLESGKPVLTFRSSELIYNKLHEIAERQRVKYIGIDHLIIGILESNGCMAWELLKSLSGEEKFPQLSDVLRKISEEINP